MRKRVIALMLLAMLLVQCVMPAYAEEGAGEIPAAEEQAEMLVIGQEEEDASAEAGAEEMPDEPGEESIASEETETAAAESGEESDIPEEPEAVAEEPAEAEMPAVEEPVEVPCQVEIGQTPEELSRFVMDTWADQTFSEAVLDVSSETLYVEDEPLDADAMPSDIPLVEDDVAATVSAIEESNAYEVESVAGDSITISTDFQSKRIAVRTTSIDSYYGAVRAIVMRDMEMTVLAFATAEAAAEAFSEISAKYPGSFVDRIHGREILANEGLSWGTDYMGMAEITELTFPTKVKVAVLDTGIATWPSAFNGRISSDSYDMTSNKRTLGDSDGHGTNVAGIIIDSTPKNVSVMAVRVFDDNVDTSDLIICSAIDYAAEHGADIINMSLGYEDYDAQYCTAYDTEMRSAYKQGIRIVCAAGNEAQNVAYTYPANSIYTDAVSALDAYGEFNYSFSCYGDKIDFCAPGTYIGGYGIYSGTTNIMSGTSQATPHVSAAYACIKCEYPELSGKSLYKKAVSYAVDLGDSGKDIWYGWGCINLSDLYEEMITCHHQWGKTTVTSIPSYTASGSGYRVCSLCGEVEDVYLKRLTIPRPDLKVSIATDGIKLSWTPVSGLDKMVIFRRTGDSETWEKLSTKTSPTAGSYVDKKVAFGQEYTYRIRYYAGDYTSSYSTACSYVYATRPTNVSLKAGTTGLKFSWDAVKGAYGYYIYRSTDGKDFELLDQVSSKVTSFTDKTATSEKKMYYYKVATLVKAPNDNSVCRSACSQTLSTKYVVPAKIKSAVFEDDSIRLAWTCDGAAKYFCVYRSVNGGSYELLTRTTETRYTDTTARANGFVWQYKIIAERVSDGVRYRSRYSKIFEASLPAVPVISKAKSAKAGELTAEWLYDGDAARYQVEYSTRSGFSASEIVAVSGSEGTRKTIKGLKSGTSYYVRVRGATVKDGVTVWSDWSAVKKAAVR